MKLIKLIIHEHKCIENEMMDFQRENPSKFFSSKNIEDIYAVIGKNGVGKSTFIEVLTKALLGELDEDAFTLIYEIDKSFYYLGTYSKDCKRHGINFEDKGKLPKDHSVLYYSPIYNPHSNLNDIKKKAWIDVSTDKLYRYSNNKNKEIDFLDQFKFFAECSTFSDRMFNFDKHFDIDLKTIDLTYFKRKYKEIIDETSNLKYVEEILIDLNYDFLNLFESKDVYNSKGIKIKVQRLFNAGIKDLQNDYLNKVNELSIEEKIHLNFLMLGVIEFLRSTSSIKLEQRIEALKLSYKTIKNFVRNDVCKTSLFFNKISKTIPHKKLISLKKHFELALHTFPYKRKRFPLTYKPSQFSNAIKLVSKVRINNLYKFGFIVSWRGISSGQLAKINMFSRLYRGFQETNRNNFFLFLDEADIYLHPEWQQSFLKDLNEFLRVMKRDNERIKNITIFLTTHSPIMISDLQHTNIFVFSSRGRKRINKPQIPTLGGNIYDLYTSAFQLNEPQGKQYEKQVQNILKSDDLNESELTSAMNVIGDDFVRLALKRRLKNAQS